MCLHWRAGYLSQSIGLLTGEASRGAFLSGMTGGAAGSPVTLGFSNANLGMSAASQPRVLLLVPTVVATPVLAALLGGARIKRSIWVAVGASICGIALLEDSGAPATIGDLWSLLSAILFGMQIWRAEVWSKRLSSKQALPILSVTGVSSVSETRKGLPTGRVMCTTCSGEHISHL